LAASSSASISSGSKYSRVRISAFLGRFRSTVHCTFGAQPEFQYFETPIIIDNVAKQVIDEAA
jgi:hypothetical protein